MATPRLLIVCHCFAPSTATGARRSTRLARFMAARGSPPAVVTAALPFYGEAVGGDARARDDFEVHEVPYSGLYAALERAGGAARTLKSVLLGLAYRRAIECALRGGAAPDLLYFCGNPFWYFPLGRYFRARCGLPYALDFADLFYMKGVPYRMAHRGGLRQHFDRAAEAVAVGGAGLLVHTTELQTAIYRRRYPAKAADEFATIRWGYDAEVLASVEPAAKERADVFRLAIFGKFATYGAGDAWALAQAVGAFHARRRAEVLHLGEAEAELEVAFRREGLSGCLKQMGMRPYRQGLAVLASADCLVLNAISDVSLPAKLYDYIGLNKPVLGFVAPDSAAGRLLDEFPGAFIVGTAREAQDALHRIAQDRIRCLDPELDAAEFSQQYQFEGLLDALIAAMEKESGRRG